MADDYELVDMGAPPPRMSTHADQAQDPIAPNVTKCPNPQFHGSPYRYCACGWTEEAGLAAVKRLADDDSCWCECHTELAAALTAEQEIRARALTEARGVFVEAGWTWDERPQAASEVLTLADKYAAYIATGDTTPATADELDAATDPRECSAVDCSCHERAAQWRAEEAAIAELHRPNPPEVPS